MYVYVVLQVGAVLLAVAACALSAEIGLAEQAKEVETPQKDPQEEPQGDQDHVRDKRRLPDPGFIIPATPMGFTRKESQVGTNHHVLAQFKNLRHSATANFASVQTCKPHGQFRS